MGNRKNTAEKVEYLYVAIDRTSMSISYSKVIAAIT